ncbi:MAG: hypothetical protein QM572_11910 [Nocardioides sp.]|uniref:hypothetical protein n=1 Tax=Nocardioides sp. TaxID=35761 RepID=UPI0039E56AFA
MARLVERYEAGATVYQLAIEFGIERRTVSIRLKAAGVSMRHQAPTNAQVDEMVRLYRSGLSMAAVGEGLGFHPASVLRHLRRRGVVTRDPHGRDRS